MSLPFPNLYTHRKVADSSAKACDICYKPSTSVLITPDKKDKYFCAPKIDEEAAKAKREKQREKELAEETAKLKEEYEEKQKKKKKEKESKDKDQDKDKDGAKDKEKAKDSDKESKKDEDKSEDTDEKKDAESEDEESRVFELKTAFYQQRLQRKRQNEAAKRDRERASQPGYFPSVPSGPPTK